MIAIVMKTLPYEDKTQWRTQTVETNTVLEAFEWLEHHPEALQCDWRIMEEYKESLSVLARSDKGLVFLAKITYFKVTSGKYYTEDEEVAWPRDPNHYTKWAPFDSICRMPHMTAICMVTPLGFPHCRPGIDSDRLTYTESGRNATLTVVGGVGGGGGIGGSGVITGVGGAGSRSDE